MKIQEWAIHISKFSQQRFLNVLFSRLSLYYYTAAKSLPSDIGMVLLSSSVDAWFCVITLVAGDQLLWNFIMILLTSKERFLHNLKLAPTVFKLGAKKCKNWYFIKTHVECLFSFRFWLFLLIVFLLKHGKHMYQQIWCVLDCIQVIRGQRGHTTKNLTFFLGYDINFCLFFGLLMKILACNIQSDFRYLYGFWVKRGQL